MIRRLLMAVMLLGLCLMAAPLPATAFSTTGGVDCSGSASGSAVCTDNTSTDPISGSNGLLLKITRIVAYIGGAAAIIVIVVSALRLIFSGSDVSTGSRTDTDVEDARRSLAGAVIGLIIIVLAASLITFVVEKL